MTWIVDTCLVIDVLEGLEPYAIPSATLLHKKKEDGLAVCPVTFVELAPAFCGDIAQVKFFLTSCGIRFDLPWMDVDTEAGFHGWQKYISLKRQKKVQKRPIADMLIGAFASRFRGLITRNVKDFKSYYPQLHLVSP